MQESCIRGIYFDAKVKVISLVPVLIKKQHDTTSNLMFPSTHYKETNIQCTQSSNTEIRSDKNLVINLFCKVRNGVKNVSQH